MGLGFGRAVVADGDVLVERERDRVERGTEVRRGRRHAHRPATLHRRSMTRAVGARRYGADVRRRQCARSGCSALATATFTFDARVRTVWLDAPRDGAARAGELCERHARVLTPPQGWELDDRRVAADLPEADAAPTLHDPVVSTPIAEVRRLLAAHTPLLARAFEASGAV
ncbi:MAG: DUF3499 family protein [Actinomycetota bacterium]